MLLPVLHALQDAFGFIPADAIAEVASRLQLSRAEVYGVISYYPFFRSAAPARHTLRICRAEACHACGAEALFAAAEDALAQMPHSALALESVHCLGLCASAPAMQVDEKIHARLDRNKLHTLIQPLCESAT